MYDKWVAPQCCPPNGDGDVEITKADGEGFADVKTFMNRNCDS